MSMRIYCTPAERTIVESLPAEVRRDCVIEEETLRYADTPASMRERLRTMRLHTPALKDFQAKAATVGNEDEMDALLNTLQGMAITEQELLDICFGLGPLPLTDLMLRQLGSIKDRQDFADTAAISELRHAVLATLQNVPPLP